MGRILALLYGGICYLMFLGSYLYFVLFAGNLFVPKTVDSGPVGPIWEALVIDLGLIILFGALHSIMARKRFKDWWTQFVPKSIERSTFVLQASLTTILLCWQWRPMTQTIWNVESPAGSSLLYGLYWLGLAIAVSTTFLIDHFELFGLKQVFLNLRGAEPRAPRFVTPLFYKVVRHPMQFGVALNLWATPHMTVGHLLLAAGMTAYILIGIHYEERDLVRNFGSDYEAYRRRVPKLIPVPRSTSDQRTTPAEHTAS